MTFIRARTLVFIPLAALPAASVLPTVPTQATAVRMISGHVSQVGSATPVSNVAVYIAGAGLGAMTTASGAYQLRNMPASATQLVFKHPCYFTVQVTIPADSSVAVSIGLPFDQASLRRPGCGGLGARGPDSTNAP